MAWYLQFQWWFFRVSLRARIEHRLRKSLNKCMWFCWRKNQQEENFGLDYSYILSTQRTFKVMKMHIMALDTSKLVSAMEVYCLPDLHQVLSHFFSIPQLQRHQYDPDSSAMKVLSFGSFILYDTSSVISSAVIKGQKKYFLLSQNRDLWYMW